MFYMEICISILVLVVSLCNFVPIASVMCGIKKAFLSSLGSCHVRGAGGHEGHTVNGSVLSYHVMIVVQLFCAPPSLKLMIDLISQPSHVSLSMLVYLQAAAISSCLYGLIKMVYIHSTLY